MMKPMIQTSTETTPVLTTDNSLIRETRIPNEGILAIEEAISGISILGDTVSADVLQYDYGTLSSRLVEASSHGYPKTVI